MLPCIFKVASISLLSEIRIMHITRHLCPMLLQVRCDYISVFHEWHLVESFCHSCCLKTAAIISFTPLSFSM